MFYFLSVELGRNLKLSILLKKIYEKAKRFFQIPRFKQYAINERIHRLLFGKKFNTAPPKKIQIYPAHLTFLFGKLLKILGKILEMYGGNF